jgi:hypothetical protein
LNNRTPDVLILPNIHRSSAFDLQLPLQLISKHSHTCVGNTRQLLLMFLPQTGWTDSHYIFVDTAMKCIYTTIFPQLFPAPSSVASFDIATSLIPTDTPGLNHLPTRSLFDHYIKGLDSNLDQPPTIQPPSPCSRAECDENVSGFNFSQQAIVFTPALLAQWSQ